ncbi:conserved membrane hypothetical protein [Vibrio chagasii]|nr:conserved membrane hypothetical protein [Vibrio chagasii]CAH7484498.1 conserved membrane hypothetical protein [Vibrio chagasii]
MLINIHLFITIISIIYVLRPNRNFDLLTAGFISQQIYFMPLLFQNFGVCTSYGCVVEDVYIIAIFLMVSFVFFSSLPVPKRSVVIKPVCSKESFWLFSLLLGLIGFMLVLIKSKGQVFFVPKRDMGGFLGYEYILWSFSSGLSLICAYSLGSRIKILISLFLLSLTVYIGFRSTAAVTLISIFLIYANDKNLSLRNLKLKYVLGVLIVGIVFFSYKGIYSAIKMQNYDLVLERIFEPSFYYLSIVNSEPFTIITILSRVIENDVRISIEYLFTPLLSLGFFGWLNLDVPKYNTVVQSLFNVDFGVASNIWAYFYSLLGFPGVFLFSVFFAFSNYLGAILMNMIRGPYLYVTVLSLSYWCFYIHRNDLFYQFALEKRVLLLGLICILGGMLMDSFSRFLGVRRIR